MKTCQAGAGELRRGDDSRLSRDKVVEQQRIRLKGGPAGIAGGSVGSIFAEILIGL
jgi:hypothetical protein